MIGSKIGMARLQYVNKRDLYEVDEIKRDILSIYRNDIRKYADNQETKVSCYKVE